MITYRAVNKTNGMWYVGSATDFERRKKEHLTSRQKSPFHNALRKGPENFTWEILEEDDREDRFAEQLILNVWYGTGFCYNLSSSASGFNSEMAREASLKRTEEGKKQGGKISGPKVGRQTHEKYPEKMKENGRNTLQKLIDMDPDHQSKAGKVGGKRGSRDKKRVGGLKCKEDGLGMFSMTPEERSAMGKENMKKVLAQRWMDPDHPELGEHAAGTLVRMQKRRGLAHGKENRVRVY
jgi:group I intron endonuclease